MADTVPGNVQWSGEHWINYLRRPGEETDSGSFSMYHTRYSQGGTGTVAFVDVPAADFATICTDNRELAAWTFDNMIKGRGNLFDRELPVVDAAITFSGDIHTNPSWTVQADGHTIVSTWNVTEPATIHWGPAPSGQKNLQIFSLLYFTYETSLTYNGVPIDGESYTHDIWRASIGGDRSSCVFALAETLIVQDG